LRAVDAPLTSDHEGIPNVSWRRWRRACRVAICRSAAFPSFIAEGVTGFLRQPEEVAGLADRLARLAGAPRLFAALGAAARRRLEEAHGYSRLGGTLRAIYADIARSQRRGDVLSLVGAT
jgi:glycosyltransferase involved in cell wall biosynthesis